MGSLGGSRPNIMHSKEFTDCIAVIRSLVLIRKQLTTVRDIISDYRAMEGENIPYAQFGFVTLEDMLKRSEQFNLQRQANGQVIISARLRPDDEHMARLVQETRSKKPAPIKRFAPPPVRSSMNSGIWVRTPMIYPPRQGSSYTPRYTPPNFNRPQPPSIHNRTPPTLAFNRPPQPSNFNAAPQPPIYHRVPQPQPTPSDWVPLPADAMPRLTIYQQQQRQMIQPLPSPPLVSQPSLPVAQPEARVVVQLDRRSKSPVRFPRKATSPPTDLRVVLDNKRRQPKPSFDPQRPRFSVKDRLQVVPEPSADPPSSDSGVSSGRSRSLPISVEEEGLSSLSISTSSDPLADLFAFCSANGIGEPHLEVYNRKVVGCRLIVDGKTFFEYAEDEAKARRLVAKTCLTHLKIAQKRTTYPVIKEEKHDLAILLHDILLHFPHGVLEKKLPEIFQQATAKSLPDGWTDIVTAYTRFFYVDSGPLAHVVYANVLGEGEAEAEEPQQTLPLPWKEPHWSIYVTYVISTSMVWARIIGSDFSVRWDVLVTEIEQSMKEEANRQKAEKATANEMYLIEQQSCWYRVRCQEADAEGKRCLAFFVDQGNEQWIPTETLFECEAKFQVLPGQAVLFTLLGLESMNENPHAKPILVRALQDKGVVAEIRTQPEDFADCAAIKAIFYDTSSEEDVNLVEALDEEICKAGQAPRLNAAGLTQVIVTGVSDRGDVFCQVPGSGVDYVQKMIDKLVQNEEALARHQGLRENLGGDSATRYLVFDRPNDMWYRAVLKVRHPLTADHQMYCLDTGCQVKVAETDIHHLEPLSKALSYYPALAIRCELYDVPKMDSRTVSRVKGLLEPMSMALAKVMLSSGVDKAARVNLYQRLDGPNKVITCINDTLRMDFEFEGASFAA